MMMKKTIADRRARCCSRLLLLAGARLVAQNREHQQMTADVRMLQEQAQQLAITIAALNQALSESLKALNARLDQANDATRKGFADQKLLIDNMGERRARHPRAQRRHQRAHCGAARGTRGAADDRADAAGAATAAAARRSIRVDPNAPAVPATTQAPPATPPPSTAGLSPTRMFETAQGRLRRRTVVAGDHRLRAVPSRVPEIGKLRRRAVLHRRNKLRAGQVRRKRLPHTIW